MFSKIHKIQSYPKSDTKKTKKNASTQNQFFIIYPKKFNMITEIHYCCNLPESTTESI